MSKPGCPGCLAVKELSRGPKSPAILRSLAFLPLPFRRLDPFSHRPAVIRVDTYADAYTESRLMRITSQSSLDALRDLFGHALVSVDQHECKLIAAVTHAQVNRQSLWNDPHQRLARQGEVTSR